jgi:hypothetical protein
MSNIKDVDYYFEHIRSALSTAYGYKIDILNIDKQIVEKLMEKLKNNGYELSIRQDVFSGEGEKIFNNVLSIYRPYEGGVMDEIVEKSAHSIIAAVENAKLESNAKETRLLGKSIIKAFITENIRPSIGYRALVYALHELKQFLGDHEGDHEIEAFLHDLKQEWVK